MRSAEAGSNLVATGLEELDALLGDGFPDRSSNLLIGPPGIGKEAICYRFLHLGALQDDACLCVTKHAVQDTVDDARGYGISTFGPVRWLDCSGVRSKLPVMHGDLNDLTGLSVAVKQFAAESHDHRIRIVFDILSPLLLLYPLETTYRFLTSLLAELKKYQSVLLATLEEGMHAPKDVVAFEQLFDGTVEMRLYEQGLKILPLLRIKKMRGLPPQPAFFTFHFAPSGKLAIRAYQGMEIGAYTR